MAAKLPVPACDWRSVIRNLSGIYYAKLADSVLIFHAFTKKTQKLPQHEIA